ncbi:MAG: 30S ribosomal protein S21 [Bacilli bacterium]|nr:30S ribosomal protein S21 [Bacilli bacterium]
MTHVSVKNGNVDGALRIFKQKFAKSGVPSEIKKRKHYDKPGVKRRNEKKENIKNSRRNRKDRD